MPNEKTFTQSEVNAMLARERKAREKLESDHATVVEAARLRVTELQAQAAALSAERDGATAKASEATGLHAKLSDEHQAYRAMHRRQCAERELVEALTAVRVLPGASATALRLLTESAEIEQDAEGAIVAVKYGGAKHQARERALNDLPVTGSAKQFSAAVSAVQQFLREHDYLLRAFSTGGAGTQRSNIGHPTATPKPDITNQRPEDLVEQGWKEGQR